MNSFAILYVFIFFRHNRYLKSSRKVDDFTGDWGCSLSWKWDHGHSTALYRGATAKYAFHFHDNPGQDKGLWWGEGYYVTAWRKKASTYSKIVFTYSTQLRQQFNTKWSKWHPKSILYHRINAWILTSICACAACSLQQQTPIPSLPSMTTW